MICTFFGHRSSGKEIEPILKSALIDLIKNHNVNHFYVGNQGGFDAIVLQTLTDLAKEYKIIYHVVLAYIPVNHNDFTITDYSKAILPDGIERIPRRFGISYRNKWMIEKSDYVVTHLTTHTASGAAQFAELAERKGKTIIKL